MSRQVNKGPPGRLSPGTVVCVVLVGACIVLIFEYVNNSPNPTAEKLKPSSPVADSSSTVSLPEHTSEEGFVSASACRECHADQFQSWHKTYHRTMTQAATPDAVVPGWNDVTLESRGRSYRLFRRGEEFWVDTIDPAAELRAFIQQQDLSQDPNPPRAERRIAMTTGSHKHQTYWMQNPSGALVQFPWVYHINTKRWVFRIDSFLRPPRDNVTYNIWNLHCIGCHSTGGQPRVDPLTHTMHSSGELGISCEACHGPGRNHVAFHRKAVKGADDSGSKMVDPRERRPEVSAQICGQCHLVSERADEEYWVQHGDPYRAGGDNFEEIRRVVHFSEDIPFRDQYGERLASRFWPDGTVRTGGREYNGLIKTACYLKGEGKRKLTCLSCHSMHDYVSPNKQIARQHTGNRACTQCHTESQYDLKLAEHTHHQSNSSGSLCVNCHMTRTSYALFSATRSHRIQSPKISASQLGERPNACNLCHLDQTKSWTAEHLGDWYKMESQPSPANEKPLAASVVWALQGDAAQRAVAAWHMGWEKSRAVSNDRWMVPVLAELLDDPYAAVRYISYESLKKHAGFENLQYDFDGPAETRQQARQQVLQEWKRRNGREPGPIPGSRVLLTPGGDWDENLARQLIEKRDNRPITILE